MSDSFRSEALHKVIAALMPLSHSVPLFVLSVPHFVLFVRMCRRVAQSLMPRASVIMTSLMSLVHALCPHRFVSACTPSLYMYVHMYFQVCVRSKFNLASPVMPRVSHVSRSRARAISVSCFVIVHIRRLCVCTCTFRCVCAGVCTFAVLSTKHVVFASVCRNGLCLKAIRAFVNAKCKTFYLKRISFISCCCLHSHTV